MTIRYKTMTKNNASTVETPLIALSHEFHSRYLL